MEPKAGLISDATAENPAEARASSRSRPETKRSKTSMSKKILILSTSPRKGGNSDGLADAFAEGAREAGHQVEKIVLYDKTIGFCRGCLACQKTLRCVIRDDADAIAQTMRSAEVIVFATPIYFYEMCGQMKTLLDRMNPLYSSDYRFRRVYMLSVAAEDETYTPEKAVSGLEGWVDCFEKAKLCGSLFVGGLNGPGEASANAEALEKAYQFGKNLE